AFRFHQWPADHGTPDRSARFRRQDLHRLGTDRERPRAAEEGLAKAKIGMQSGALVFLSGLVAIAARGAEPLNLVLPTDNDALFRGAGAEFYQYIERDYHGEKTTPWEGGRYGFVRNPV